MLQKLYIKNYALIKEVEIPFYSGMSIITGETGAGKSILLGALKLVLGERADRSQFLNNEEKCIIEAEFQMPEATQKYCVENDMEYESISIIRREIAPDGKSRSFFNDSPVLLQNLQELSAQLIDIHSQFDNALLFDESYQFQFLDNFTGLQKESKDYQSQYHLYKQNQSVLQVKQDQLQSLLQSQDYNQFLYEELEAVPLQDVDIEALEEELKELENVQEIQESLGQFSQIVNEDSMGLNAQLQSLQQLLQKTSQQSQKLSFLRERFESIRIDFQDLESDVENYSNQLEYEPERIAQLSEQVNQIHRLLQKHQVQSVEELEQIKTQLAQEQEDFSTIEADIQNLKEEIDSQKKALEQQAEKLHESREKSIPKLVNYVTDLLQSVGLEKAQFKIALKPTETLTVYGKESIQLLFSANTGMPLQAIQKGISGGERSRVMLVLKKVMAEHQQLATLILDEIDTGVSGKVADDVGRLMQSMAKNMQLIVITHLAQIASKGSHHYKVSKTDTEMGTETAIRLLMPEERIEEIAQLISGDTLTEASIHQAKTLLEG